MRIIISIVTLFVFAAGFSISDRIEQRIKKEVLNVFKIEDYSKQSVIVSDEINEVLPLKISEDNLFKIENSNETIGYYYLGKAFGKADYFDFIIIFDKDLIVSKVSVLVYREDHGGEIGSKRWLRQFIGTTNNQTLKYQDDIVGISGATISVKSMTNEVNKMLKTIHILNQKNVL